MPVKGMPDTSSREWEDLPPFQQNFVEHFVRWNDAEAAARAAGYKDDDRLPAKAAELKRMLSRHIDQRTLAYAQSTEMAMLGLHTLRTLAEQGADTVKFKAAQEILNRAIPDKPKEHNVNHNILVKRYSDEDLDRRIELLQERIAKLGGNVIDAQPE